MVVAQTVVLGTTVLLPPARRCLDEIRAQVQFNGFPQWEIAWSQVREIAIEVTVVVEVGYSEAFWQLTGEGLEFGCPVELVVGAEAFNGKLFAFPGFDHDAYRQAREAETAGRAGRFLCWRAGNS